MRTPHVVLLASGLFFGAWLVSCGTVPPACSSSTCDGCCSAEGQCRQLSSDSACGRGGVACKACGAAEMCSFGTCVSSGFSSGGGTSGFGGGTSGFGGGTAMAGGTAMGGGSVTAGGSALGGGSTAGGSAVFCGPSTCAGCCRSDGSCNLAPSSLACGSQGQLCRDCQALGQTCSQATFSCVSGAGGGSAGGGSAGGTPSAGGAATDNRLRLFLTSSQFSGNLGGLSGADRRCQTAATAGNKGGTWIAFLATSSVTGLSRVTANGPWYQERGLTFLLTYNNVANLQTGALSTLATDEQGRMLSNSFTGDLGFWTGMNADATSSLSTCSNWTSANTSGSAGSFSSLDSSLSTGCSNGYRLLCLEQSRTPRPPPVPSVRKRVFLTSTQFSGNLGGLAGADQRCQTAATAGNKGGTWIAFLATSTTTGPSRVTSTGPWYQERGLTFLLTYNNVANLETGALATLATDEQGRMLSNSFTGDLGFWSGMNADATSSLSNCSNWTSASTSGSAGSFSSLDSSLSSGCSNSYRLLCLEQ